MVTDWTFDGVCEAPRRQTANGYFYRRCEAPPVGLRPMRSLAGGFATNALGITEPKYACDYHFDLDVCFAYEPEFAGPDQKPLTPYTTARTLQPSPFRPTDKEAEPHQRS